jgi:hypothetical protein
MKHRFLLHSLSHRVIAVDITGEGLNSESLEKMERRTVPILTFRSWEPASDYFRALGADQVVLEDTADWLKKCGTASLTIL